MMEADLDDTHLCIKCSATISGLDSYIEHRKTGCAAQREIREREKVPSNRVPTSRRPAGEPQTDTTRVQLDHTYDSFSYQEPEAPTTYVNKTQHGGKTSKSLTDAYDLPYELGADVFFSSLQLQSVQSTGPSTSGKSGSGTIAPQRQKISESESGKVTLWLPQHSHVSSSSTSQRNSERLMNAFSEIVKPSYDHIFKPINFPQESPELSEDEDEDEDENAEVDDDDDEDFDAIAAAAAAHASGGKWKSSPLMRDSPPVVPATHTGGKWRPEHRPQLRVSHTQISRLSPNWDEQVDEVETPGTPDAQQHPPAEHTKGKWIPGTKLQRLEYKEVRVVSKAVKADYWCNICCRRLKNKSNYENHLKTGYHRKRAEPEQQLEKASLAQLRHKDVRKVFEEERMQPKTETVAEKSKGKKRLRRATYIRCDLCKHVMARHLIGKHLISHYHYRRMNVNLSKSLRMILEHIHSIVLQSPYQCRPCRFYANTEETFMLHWESAAHLDVSASVGVFYCSYCQYECEDNNQMRRHLLGMEHKEVILAINRSVPICISNKLSIECCKCKENFRFNAELRRHMRTSHPGVEIHGTASDLYQSRFKCLSCGECCRSQVALQRHEKYKHSVYTFFCSICNLQFTTPCQARRHRKTLEHRHQAALAAAKKISEEKKKKNLSSKDDENPQIKEEPQTVKKFKRRKSESKKKSNRRSKKLKSAEMFKCNECTRLFDTKPELKVHRDSEHAIFSHMCTCCGESFATAQALGRHTRHCVPLNKPPTEPQSIDCDKVEVIRTWTCDQCGFSSPYESELIYHRLHHTHGTLQRTQLIKCPLCTKSFRKHSLRCHLRQHTNEKIFECEFCKLKFSRRHNLKDHISKQHKPEDNTNDDVKRTTLTDSNVANVANVATTDEKKRQNHEPQFRCDICDKHFATKYTLKQHQLVRHGSGQRDFPCTHANCRYAAISQSALKVHLASHAEENLKCDHPKCHYVGKSVMHLLKHRRSHIPPSKVHSCDKCSFKARTKGHIRRHVRHVHEGQKSNQCPYCDFKCSSADNLRKHILKTNKHPGKFIYECKECKRNEIGTKSEIFKTNFLQEMQNHLSIKREK